MKETEIQKEASIRDIWTCINHLSIGNMKLTINREKGDVERTLDLKSIAALCIVSRLVLLYPWPCCSAVEVINFLIF